MRRTWSDEFSGGSVLVVVGGLLLAVAGVAATASQPSVLDLPITLAFGALIAVGEFVRVNLPGDRSAAPLGAAGGLAYALLGDFRLSDGPIATDVRRPAGRRGQHHRDPRRCGASHGAR